MTIKTTKPTTLKKRVLFLMQSGGFAGAEKRIFRLLECLDYDQVDVTLCLSENHIPASVSRQHPRVQITTFSSQRRGEWRRVLQTHRPGKVIFCKTWISNFGPAYFISAWAYTRGDVHMIEFSEAPTLPGRPGRFGILPINGRLRFKAMLGARLMRSITTMSGVLKDRLARVYGFPRGRIHVAYADLDWQKFSPRPADAPFTKRPSLGISPDDTVIITVGRLCPEKGINKSITAFSRALQATGRRDVWLWVLGQGPEEAALKQLAAQQGIPDRVVFLGFQDDIEHYFQESDIFIHAADNEASGTVFIEAVAAGLVCLLTDSNCGATEYFSGYKYNVPNTIEALANGLVEILRGDRNEIRVFARAFREKFFKKYSDPQLNEIVVAAKANGLPMIVKPV